MTIGLLNWVGYITRKMYPMFIKLPDILKALKNKTGLQYNGFKTNHLRDGGVS